MDVLSTVFESYLNGLPYLLSHFVIAIVILIFGIFLHFKITPIDETATSPQKVEEQFTPEKMTELSNGLRNNKSIVQLVCET